MLLILKKEQLCLGQYHTVQPEVHLGLEGVEISLYEPCGEQSFDSKLNESVKNQLLFFRGSVE